jgi:hypothetical protein
VFVVIKSGFFKLYTDKKESPDLSDDGWSSLSSDSEESKMTNEDRDEEEELMCEWKPTGMGLGDWEQHTRVRHRIT